MKSFTVTALCFLFSFAAIAQNDFTYDTIRVSRYDERNIYQQREKTLSHPPIYTHDKAVEEKKQQPIFDKRRLRFGGNIALSFSRDYSILKLAPQVGYQFNSYVMAGIGGGYSFYKYKFWKHNERQIYRNNYIGTNLFANLYPIDYMALSIRPEINYMWQSIENETTRIKNKYSTWVPSLVVGVGLRMGRVHAMLYYDVVGADNSPYPSHLFYGLGVYF